MCSEVKFNLSPIPTLGLKFKLHQGYTAQIIVEICCPERLGGNGSSGSRC